MHTLRSIPDEGGDVCKVWFRLVQKCEFVSGRNKQINKQTNKNEQKTISALYIRYKILLTLGLLREHGLCTHSIHNRLINKYI